MKFLCYSCRKYHEDVGATINSAGRKCCVFCSKRIVRSLKREGRKPPKTIRALTYKESNNAANNQ